jgi:HTH-type transcriptional regulator/antitoxin HipB
LTPSAVHVRTPKEIGLAIQERRRQLGLDQAELARRAGVSRQWVIAIEQGKPGAALALVMRALKALDLPLWLGELPIAASATPPASDLDAVLERARGKRK